MTLLNETVISLLEQLVPGLEIEAAPSEEDEGGFFVSGVLNYPVLLSLPVWTIHEYRSGFGGWLIFNAQSKGSVHFVRQKFVHESIGEIIAFASEESENGGNLRSQVNRDKITSFLHPEGFFFQTFDEQFAQFFAGLLINLEMTSSSAESRRKVSADLKREVTKWLNHFPMVMSSPESLDNVSVIVQRDQIGIGYPTQEECPYGGVPETLRDLFIEYLENSEGFSNCWNEGMYTAAPASTSKSHPGDWITSIPSSDSVVRDTPWGRQTGWALSRPRFATALGVLAENAKREQREIYSAQKAWDLARPKDITRRIWTGYEHYMGEAMAKKVTEVFVLFGAAIDVNVYPDPNKGGELLNLDDICTTPEGRINLQTERSVRKSFSWASWQDVKSRYQDQFGFSYNGVHISEDYVRVTAIEGTEIFEPRYTVVLDPRPTDEEIRKVLVGSTLKAMTKSLEHNIVCVDRRGNRFSVDLVISGQSILEKKVYTLPLTALAARAEMGFIEHLDHVIAEDRKPTDSWDAHEDFVKEVGAALKTQGEHPEGWMDVYAYYEDGSSEYLGEAVGGFLRACVMNENEKSSSQTRDEDVVTHLISMQHHSGIPIEISPEAKKNINKVAKMHRNLQPFTLEY